MSLTLGCGSPVDVPPLEEHHCMLALSCPALSAPALVKFRTVKSINWGQLGKLLLQYGALAIQALEVVLPTLGVGTEWSVLLQAILAFIEAKLPATT